jgi:hypothetical protein
MNNLSFNPAANTTFNNAVKFADQPAFKLDAQAANTAAEASNVATSQDAALGLFGPKKAAEEPKLASPESHTWWNPAPQLPSVRTGSGQPMTVPNGFTTASQVATNTWANNNFNPMLDAGGIARNFDVRTPGDAQTIARNLDWRGGDVSNPQAHI